MYHISILIHTTHIIQDVLLFIMKGEEMMATVPDHFQHIPIV